MKILDGRVVGAGALVVAALVVWCSAQVRNTTNTVSHNDSGLALVTGLADQYRASSSEQVLRKLAALVADPRAGANAAARLAELQGRLTADQIESIVIPALANGLRSPQPSTRVSAP